MKRVVAITLVLVIVTSLFSFSVFAESPVQPLQVVTYSDTSTQLRISGTAERLHYNVDSFQVVFTNPPNNYGTACTPVLVSFRFYNSSDLPAYVGQAEFEIVCTNGTGSTNLIIYGYDQISTDLFVAESTYSTSEVGRIGIGASNDFAYYTGFVVPPKTSLYFSAIVYVNASAYEGVSNVTGSQEQVNQLTMSSLNLYTNQISFSADYPYHNQPIDFTDVIDAITDIDTDAQAIQSLIEDIKTQITFTGTYTIPTDISYSNDIGYWSYTRQYTDFYTSTGITKMTTFLLNDEIELQAPSTVYHTYSYVTPYYFRVRVDNQKDYTLLVNNRYLTLPIVFAYRNATYLIYDSSSHIFMTPTISYRTINNVPYVEIAMPYDTLVNGQGVIPQGNIFSMFTLLVLHNQDDGIPRPLTNPVANYPDYVTTRSDDDYPVNPLSYIAIKLNELLKSLTRSSTDDNTEEAQDMNDEIHEEEQIWYDNNSEALEAVGLSNYRFSPSQSSGITQAVTQFQAVWNALGQWTNVYIFILILSISTYIIRHEPTTRVKQYRSSVQAERAERISYYGKKNAESRAASSGSTFKAALRRRK